MQDTLSKNEKIKFKNSLLSLTNNIILGKSVSIDNEINNIDQLEIISENIFKYKTSNLAKIRNLLEINKTLGTLPFSILARMAFISESFLRSLVQENILKPFQITQIKNNIETILSDFINDKNKVAIKQISKSAF